MVRPQLPKDPIQEGGAGQAVHIVISDDQDLLFLGDGLPDPVNGRGQIGHLFRRTQPAQISAQKLLGLVGSRRVPVNEQTSNQRMDADGLDQPVDKGLINRFGFPNFTQGYFFFLSQARSNGLAI